MDLAKQKVFVSNMVAYRNNTLLYIFSYFKNFVQGYDESKLDFLKLNLVD